MHRNYPHNMLHFPRFLFLFIDSLYQILSFQRQESVRRRAKPERSTQFMRVIEPYLNGQKQFTRRAI